MRIKESSGIQLWLSANDTYNWAHREGSSWPGSTLSGRRLFAEFDSNGDLVDFTIDGKSADDFDSHEFNCIIADYLGENYSS